MTSSVSAYPDGGPKSPVERPKAPAAMASSTSAAMRPSSSGRGARAASPMTAVRTVPCPTSVAAFRPSGGIRSRKAPNVGQS
jgi:hypothetical protein